MEKENTKAKILKILLKQFTTNWTITALAKKINMSRVGIWKVLKSLEIERLVTLSPIGKGKTNIFSISLNWENPILEKKLSLILTEEALEYQRWINNFTELQNKVVFLILFGSILHNPKEANDIDLFGMVSNKTNFLVIEGIIQKVQKVQIKKIHSENFTKPEFEKELKKPNKIFIDAMKKGVILFGQEKFVKFIKNILIK